MDKILKKGMKPASLIFLGLYICVFAVALVFMSNYYWIGFAGDAGKKVYSSLQSINDMLLYTGVVGVVAFALFAIVSSLSRKYYYIGNLVMNIVGAAASMIMALVTLVLLILVLPSFSANFESFQEVTNTFSNGTLSVNYVCLTLALVALILSIIASVLYIVLTVLKYRDSSRTLKLKAKVVENDAE